MNWIKNLFVKEKITEQEPTKELSKEEVEANQKEIEQRKKIETVRRLNDDNRSKGSLCCYKCGRSSGLYKINLRKKIVIDIRTKKPVKRYICNYCQTK